MQTGKVEALHGALGALLGAASVSIEFLDRALRNFDFTPYLSGTTRSKLTQGQLMSAPLPIPPLSLQESFTTASSRVEPLVGLCLSSGHDLTPSAPPSNIAPFRGEL
ncbi:MAG: hypothetical protein NVS4B3_22310 [Gemmatimonadaceae bacterium]